MSGSRKKLSVLLSLLMAAGILLAGPEAGCASQVKLTADTLTFDPETRLVRAEGNVRLERQGLELSAGSAEGDTGGDRFRAWSSVKARWSGQKIDLSADEVTLFDRLPQKITAAGRVLLTRPGEKLAASSLEWIFGQTPEYVARGGVTAEMPGRVLEAGEAGRKGDLLWASQVKRFEDRREKISLRAGRIEARAEGEGLRELAASGEVSAVLEGENGIPVTLKGDRLLYSKAKGTVALVGNAEAFQAGRNVRSETILYDIASRRIEAQGRPQLIFTPGKESKSP
jgi:lipopolysaccharide transport protein LptA